MAFEKISKRSDDLVDNKAEYARVAAIMADCTPEDVLVVGCKLTEEDAKAKLQSFLDTSNISVSRGINAKLLKAIKAATPVMRKEYYGVIMSYFNVSKVEYGYSYRLNGNLINMNPKVVNCSNMNFTVSVETLDGRYYQDMAGKRTLMRAWDGLLESELVDEFEDGFVAHTLLAEDSSRESKASMRSLNSQLYDKMVELTQADIGKARKVVAVDIVDKEYTYATKVLAAPFYIFNYDLGKEVVTISVDAYTGEVGTPIENNPLGRALFETPEGPKPPKFNIVVCLVLGIVVPVIGAAFYCLDYLSKKKKAPKRDKYLPYEIPKYTLEEMKALL